MSPAVSHLPSDRLLNREEAARFLGLKVQTLAKWSLDGRYLPVVKCGRAVRYRPSDLEAFVQRQTTPASD